MIYVIISFLAFPIYLWMYSAKSLLLYWKTITSVYFIFQLLINIHDLLTFDLFLKVVHIIQKYFGRSFSEFSEPQSSRMLPEGTLFNVVSTSISGIMRLKTEGKDIKESVKETLATIDGQSVFYH